jgi:hypothetical protein
MAVQYAFGKIVTQGLDLNVDAADPTSYPGSGTTWTSVVNRSITGSLVSCSYSSDFKGGIVFNNPSASVQFPGTVANYGTGSFTVEMAFRPSSINGIHYLVSKNSGSFPNWGVYLSGSGGQGKLWTEFRISSTVSCSYSSSTTFTTSSNYSIDVTFAPFVSGAITYVNGLIDSSLNQAAGGILTSTSPLILGNTTASLYGFSGSLYNIKIYSSNFGLNANQVQTNYNLLNYRMNLPRNTNFRVLETFLVGGGGGSGQTTSRTSNGGGGAGGVLNTVSTIIPVSTTSIPVVVGAGGAKSANGGNTYLFNRLDLTAFGGGTGLGFGSPIVLPSIGGSGGGGVVYSSAGTSYNYPGASGIAGQGNSGGTGVQFISGSPSSGGGGGAGSAGQDGTFTRPGNGGSGSYYPSYIITGKGSPTGWFGGGGAGLAGDFGSWGASANGGIGGGGASDKNGQNGTVNTGGGGGASGANNVAGAGGSGLAVIRYAGTPIATGGIILQSGSYTYHMFTSSGIFTFL